MGEGISAASGGEGWVNHLSSRTFLGSILKPAQCEEFFRHIPGPRKNQTRNRNRHAFVPGSSFSLPPDMELRLPSSPQGPVFNPFALLFRNPAYLPNGESPQNV